ncbi:MAG TPA: hypothetical protein VLA97_15205 [Nocardioidaceae bacterium]|nr:hypothetical protein [Nocardioidaceae bacterium]
MRASRVAAIAALAGGVAWLASAFTNVGVDQFSAGGLGLVTLSAGYAAFALATAAAGYSLVDKAPLWLRLVVSLALLLLAAMVWSLVVQALDSDWLCAMLGGVSGVLFAVVVLARSRRVQAPVPVRGRRAAR